MNTCHFIIHVASIALVLLPARLIGAFPKMVILRAELPPSHMFIRFYIQNHLELEGDNTCCKVLPYRRQWNVSRITMQLKNTLQPSGYCRSTLDLCRVIWRAKVMKMKVPSFAGQ